MDGDASTADAAWAWSTAITNSWSLGAAAAGMTRASIACVSIPITQEMWIDGFRLGADNSDDDDHQLLMVSPSSVENGACTVQPLPSSDELIYAAGLGSNSELALPAGTAVHVTPSMGYLVLYDHLVNDTTSAITGSTTIEIHQVADPATVAHDVDMVLGGGPSSLMISPTHQTQTSFCTPTQTAGYQWNVIALWPHMHDSGTHITVSVAGAAAPILDTDYSYLDEHWYPIPEAQQLVDTNAELDVTCTMAKVTGTLGYDEIKSESQGDTVCWTGIYKWPTGTDPSTAQGVPYGPEVCVDGIASTHLGD
jgi:hypothetical protein